MHLDKACVKPLFEQFGPDRMEWVMANTLMLKEYDGRFSRSNKEWASAVGVTIDKDSFGSVRNDDYALSSHPAVLDGFISLARDELVKQREAVVQLENEDRITVLVVEPGKKPYEKEIDPGLESLQNEVGGYIQATYPYDDPVAIICDEEGKLNGKDLNRALRGEDGSVYDIIAGTFLVAGLGEEDFASLTREQADHYARVFAEPERFMRMSNGTIKVTTEKQRPSVRDSLQAKKKAVSEPGKSGAGSKKRGGDAL